MKRATPQIMIVLIFLLIAPEMFGQEFTFRGHRWGASMEEIIATEGEDGYILLGSIQYDVTLAGYDANLLFWFPPIADDKYGGLEIARYTIRVTNEDSIFVFNELSTRLRVLYGNPTFDPSERYAHWWNVNRTSISIRIGSAGFGNNTGLIIRIDYISPYSRLNPLGNF